MHTLLPMVELKVAALKVTLPFKAGQLPISIDPENPAFVLNLDGLKIHCKINAKAARKLRVHQETGGGAVLSGKLVSANGQWTLTEAGFQFLPPPGTPGAANQG